MTKANPNLIAVGDNCLDAYLSKGFVTVGGNALNVAVQWRRQGLNARYFGALGPDARSVLSQSKGGGKTAKLAKALLAHNAKPTVATGEADLLVVKARVSRATRWQNA